MARFENWKLEIENLVRRFSVVNRKMAQFENLNLKSKIQNPLRLFLHLLKFVILLCICI